MVNRTGKLTALGCVGPTYNHYWPDSPEERRQAHRAQREIGWVAALRGLALEATVVRVAAAQLASGQPLDADDDARLALAVDRIDRAAAVLVQATTWRPTA